MIAEIVTISPEVQSGTPVFAGTRVPIRNLFDYLKRGDTVDDFLNDFPSVSRVQVERILTLVVDINSLNVDDENLAIAILLFADEKVTIGQAAQIAKIPQFLFQKELAKRKIPIHYGEEEYLQDLETISKMEVL